MEKWTVPHWKKLFRYTIWFFALITYKYIYKSCWKTWTFVVAVLQYFLSEIINFSSCSKCKHLVVNKHDTRSFFDENLCCLQKVQGVTKCLVTCCTILLQPLFANLQILVEKTYENFLQGLNNILSVTLLAKSNWISILVNKRRTNYSMTRNSNPNGNLSTEEWLLYKNIRTFTPKESLFVYWYNNPNEHDFRQKIICFFSKKSSYIKLNIRPQ